MTSPQGLDNEDLDKLLSNLKDIVEREANSTLALQLKDVLLRGKYLRQGPLQIQFPSAFKTNMILLKAEFNSKKDKQKEEMMSLVRRCAQKIVLKEMRLCSILLQTQSLKQLAPNYRLKLNKIYEVDRSSQQFLQYLTELIQEGVVEKRILKEELKDRNPLTYTQCFSFFEETKGLLSNQYQKDCCKLQGKMLVISDPNNTLPQIQGLILNAQFEKSRFNLVINHQSVKFSGQTFTDVVTFSIKNVSFSITESFIKQIMVETFNNQNETSREYYSFQNEEISKQNIELIEIQKSSVQQKLEELKDSIVHLMIHSSHFNDQLDRLRAQLASDSLDCTAKSYPLVSEQIQLIGKIGDKLKKPGDNVKLLTQIIHKANFQLLVKTPKRLVLLGLLKKSLEQAEKLQGKDIKSVNGSTGEGKTTTTLYLSGCDMEKIKKGPNKGNYRIAPGQISEQQQADIGYDRFLSKTSFSQGLSVRMQKYQNLCPKAKAQILCDNPGFDDTRGQIHEICTNFSMDKSIQKCKSIKKLVLVMTYATFDLKKGELLFREIRRLRQLYPALLSPEGGVFPNFYILVTKTEEKDGLNQIRKICLQGISELQKLKSNKNRYTLGSQTNDKIGILSSLLQMHTQKRILMIDLNNSIEERQSILNQLSGDAEQIPKTQYRPMMDDNEQMREMFQQKMYEQCTILAEKIFSPFQRQLEEQCLALKKQDECSEQIYCLENYTISLNNHIIKLTAEIEKKQIKIKKIDKEVDRIYTVAVSQEELSTLREQLELDFCKEEEFESQERSLLKQQKDVHKRKDTEICQNQQMVIQIQMMDEKINEIEQKNSRIQNQLNSMSQGKAYWPILVKEFKAGRQHIQSPENVFNIGEEEHQVTCISHIPKDHYYFSQTPKDFDPNKFLQSPRLAPKKKSEDVLTLRIKSRGSLLTHLRVNEGDNVIQLAIKYTIPKSKRQDQMPFFVLQEEVTRQEYFKKEIEAFRVEKFTNQTYLYSLKEIIRSSMVDKKKRIERKLFNSERQLIEIEANILKSQNDRKRFRELKQVKMSLLTKQQVIDRLKAKRNDQRQCLTSQITTLRLAKQNSQIRLKNTIEQLRSIRQNEEKYQHRQPKLWTLLVRNELQNTVPSGFQEIVQMAVKMEEESIKSEHFQKEKKEKADIHIKCFKSYLKKYREIKKQLQSIK